MLVREFIELSNQKLVDYIKERILLDPLIPDLGPGNTEKFLGIETAGLYNRYDHRLLLKRSQRHFVCGFSLRKVYINRETNAISCTISICTCAFMPLGYILVSGDSISIYDFAGNNYPSLHDLVYEDKRFS